MHTNTATKLETQPDKDREQLEAVLNNWREHLLRWLGDEMAELNRERQDAEEGLAIAHRKQGEVAEDVIGYLWDQLEDKSNRLFRLARISDRIEAMELPELIVLFSRTEELKTWAWEGERWQLPDSMF
jgi:hypothetical protein